MTDCTHLSDRMPAVARGSARWSATDEDHLAGCRDCSAEWRLVQRAAALGRTLHSEMDASATAERVVLALRSAPVARRSTTVVRRALIPLAMAAGLLLAVWRGGVPGRHRAVTPPVAASLLPELEPLSDSQLESVLRSMPPAASPAVGSFDELNEDELTQVLHDLEG